MLIPFDLNRIELIETPNGIDNLKLLPKTRGIYFIFDDKIELLYIGQSKNIQKRIREHNYGHYQTWFYEHAQYISFIEVDSNISKIETRYIKKYRPKYNREKNW